MRAQEALECIVNIERRFDVNQVTFNGVCVWPFLRILLWRLLYYEPDSQLMQNRTIAQRALAVARSTLFPLRAALRARLQAPRLERVLRRDLAPCDLLFYSLDAQDSDIIEGRQYNRHIDPFHELLAKDHRLIKIQLGADRASDRPHYWPPVRFEQPYALDRFSMTLRNFGALDRVVRQAAGGPILGRQVLCRMLNHLFAAAAWYDRVLDVVEPKLVFIAFYYHLQGMALALACRRRGVPLVDIQHGAQGTGPYTHWTRIPAEGYALLPEFFWTWGEEASRNILRHQPAGTTHHQPVVGGNLWLARWRAAHDEPADPMLAELEQRVKAYRKVIAYSMQPFLDPYPPLLLEAMQQAPEDWLWLIRLHPGQRSDLEQLRRPLVEQGLRHVEIERSTGVGLYPLLRLADHHLTQHSTVCYEALSLGVPTTIISQQGREVYREYIDRGIFHHAASSAQLLGSLRAPPTAEQMHEEVPYIVTSPSVARDALAQLLERDAAGSAR